MQVIVDVVFTNGNIDKSKTDEQLHIALGKISSTKYSMVEAIDFQLKTHKKMPIDKLTLQVAELMNILSPQDVLSLKKEIREHIKKNSGFKNDTNKKYYSVRKAGTSLHPKYIENI